MQNSTRLHDAAVQNTAILKIKVVADIQLQLIFTDNTHKETCILTTRYFANAACSGLTAVSQIPRYRENGREDAVKSSSTTFLQPYN